MQERYRLQQDITACANGMFIEIPAGAVVEVQGTFARRGTVEVLWEDRTVRAFVTDLLESATLDVGERD